MSNSQAVYRIDNMDCSSEEAQIRARLANVQGVSDLVFDLKQRTLTVVHDLASLDSVETALKEIGMRAKLQTARPAES
jgi:Zn2+/Cd2+-exporting ATPase|uniref:cation transporter n=1 Tax=uncultured Acidovorax sp. TaxID=158751 RepID=UPI000769A42D|nr:heavy-metal-associated domain-containing protein [uncultured Acidovorax sp.]